MSENKMPATGSFCWNELATTDAGAAQSFYKELLGWRIKESTGAGMQYNEIIVGDEHVGGIYTMGPECGDGDAPPHWTAYVAVDDVDAKARQVWELGGKVCVPPTDIPNTGRFCLIKDPTGATLALITLNCPDS